MLGNVGSTTVESRAACAGVAGGSSLAAAGTPGCRTWDGSVKYPGENIFGPFEAGFGSQQSFILTWLGCSNAADGYVEGGIDTLTAESMVAYSCGVELPRYDGLERVSPRGYFVDESRRRRDVDTPRRRSVATTPLP